MALALATQNITEGRKQRGRAVFRTQASELHPAFIKPKKVGLLQGIREVLTGLLPTTLVQNLPALAFQAAVTRDRKPMRANRIFATPSGIFQARGVGSSSSEISRPLATEAELAAWRDTPFGRLRPRDRSNGGVRVLT